MTEVKTLEEEEILLRGNELAKQFGIASSACVISYYDIIISSYEIN